MESNQLKNLQLLSTILDSISHVTEKVILLRSCFEEDPIPFKIQHVLRDEKDEYLLLCLFATGQGHLLQKKEYNEKKLYALLEKLKEIDDFYAEIGGIIGYQKLVLQLLSQEKESFNAEVPFSYSLYSD